MTLLLLPLLLLSSTISSSQCLSSQTSALLALKQSLHYFNHQLLASWLPTADCCHWEGVLCADPASGMITSLDLSDLKIFGNLSHSLFNLTALTSLNLAFNDFDQIPIPDSFHLLPKLTTLNLSYAGFTGQIPASIGTLTHLISLDLSGNDLKLNDPDLRTLIKNLRGLRELYLDGVNISANGTEWGTVLSASAPRLRELSLRRCSISGPIDSSLTGLRSLRLLRLDYNELDCAVPDFFGNFTSLSELSLDSCGLKGELPETISKLRNLARLYLGYNSLTGQIPSYVFNLSGLEALVLSSNNFSGTIDLSLFASLRNLSFLELSNNRLSVQDGATDDSSLSFPTMRILGLAACNLTSIPSVLRNQTKMLWLDLSNNRISGSIPNWIWGIPNLNLSCNFFTNVERPLPRLSVTTQSFSIDLHSNNLQGPIPALRLLRLDFNELDCAVPDFIGNLTSLSELSLHSCGLKAELPETISKLRNLAELDLSSNKFSGTIDLSLFASLRNLSSLDLSNNRLSVQDDSSLSFPALNSLSLAACNLTNIPSLLRNQTTMVRNLLSLDLSNNRISGSIPNWIWGIGDVDLSCNFFTNVERPLPQLSVTSIIDLHSNNLQGPIPLPSAQIDYLDYSNNNFTSIIPPNISLYLMTAVYFSLSNNSLTGSIPQLICSASKLEVLDLGLNKLTGPIPQCLMGNITNLRVLNLEHNQLTGPIPNPSPEQGCGVESLNVNGNQLSGKLPSALTNCPSLEVLDLGNNRFHDSFPFWLSNLPGLKVLVLRSNKLYGTVDSPKFPMLLVLDLSSNNFHGVLSPECFSSFQSMMSGSSSTAVFQSVQLIRFSYSNSYSTNFYYALTVTFQNREMPLVKILAVFTCIDLSRNKFEGSIPQVIGNITWLDMLNMSHNLLTGRIPISLSGLVELQSLDLSSNQLSGQVPQELVDLTFLSVLNLSDNKLIGRMPQGGQLQTFDVDAFQGNEGLCGAPLVKMCSNVVSHNESTDEVVSDPSWELVVVVVSGFVTGLAVVFWGLVYWENGRSVFEEKVDRMTWALLDSVAWWGKVKRGDQLGPSNHKRRQRN